MSYDFTMQGGSDANVGSVGVFVAGRADATITVNVVNGGSGTYKIIAGCSRAMTSRTPHPGPITGDNSLYLRHSCPILHYEYQQKTPGT